MTKLYHSRVCHLTCLTSLIALSFPISNGFAETVTTEEWQIAADKIIRYEDPKSIIAEGNVVLTKREQLPPELPKKQQKDKTWAALLEEPTPGPEETTGMALETDTAPRYETKVTIQADWIAYDVERSSIKARGHVTIKGADDEIRAEEGTVDLNKETGTFTNATILRKSMDLHLEGKSIEKTGFNTYHIQDGWAITCKLKDNETPPWSFASTDTTITEGGYAVFKHATFRIKDVPVLYTPWMIVPAKNKRQTGLMFPEFSNSDRNGFGLNLPLFVNVSDFTDLTLFPESYTDRGVMPGMEFRYVLGEVQKGTFMGSFLQDDLTDPSEIDYYRDTGYTHTNKDRYWLRGKIDHDLANNLYSRIDLDIVSDRDYLTEFNTGYTGFTQTDNRFLSMYGRNFQNRTEDQRLNTMKVLKAWDSMSVETHFLAVNDVRADKTLPTSLWKLPAVDFTGSLPVAETSLALDWDADYVNYWQEDGIGSHRVDLFPRLSTPVPLGAYLESRAEVGMRQTSYIINTYGDGVWNQDDTLNRSLFNLHGEIGSTLLRNFEMNGGEGTSWDHRLRPYAQYDYLPETNQDDLPIFDEVDRIEDRNAITYGINNFFELFSDSSRGSSRDYGYFKVWESYDFRQKYSARPLTPVSFELGWTPIDNFALFYQTDVGVYGEGVTLYNIGSNYRNSRGDSFALDYRYNGVEKILGSPYNSTDIYNTTSPFYSYYDSLEDIHQINASVKARIINTISAAYQIEHSLSQSQTIEQNISLIYQPDCWSVELRSHYTPGDHGVMLLFNLANIGTQFGVNIAGQ
ncbi:MAG: LPS assembly protein LptD [Desulfobulbaceae bacterium]